MFWYFPKRWFFFFVFCFFVGRWALNRPRYSFSNLFLVREREREQEREREACTEVTTVYSSAHTINLWAHLCVPQRHTALQVLLPSLKASTEADSDYCVTGEVENKEMERWSSKLCWWTFPVPLPSIEQSRLLYRLLELWIIRVSIRSEGRMSNGYIISF